MKDPPPQANGWPHSKVALAQGGEGREQHHGVGAEMVRLQPEEIEEIAEEFAYGKSEPAVEVRKEEDALAGLGSRHKLGPGDAAVDVLRNLAGTAEEKNVHLRDIGALPGAASAGASGVVTH